jgi:hypothetical protein
LSSLATTIYAGEPFPVERNGEAYLADGVSVDYRLAGQLGAGSAGYNAANGVIDLITVRPRGTEISYQLHQMLEVYGQPDQVLFEADTDYDLFHILLYYPERGITAYYEGTFMRLNRTYRVCPQGIGPELWLWSPGKVITVNDDQPVAPETIRLMSPIEEVTDLDLDTLYQTYRLPDSPCFETPRDMWELP